MRAWKTSWYPNAQAADHYMKMDMSNLESATGNDFDRQFLSMMTEHHRQAVAIFKSSMPLLKHKESKSMAEAGIKNQSAEIEQMKKLLK